MSKLTGQIFFSFIILVLGLFFLPSVFAASISFSDGNPSKITDSNQEYQVKVNLSIDASDGTNYYLRGVFFQTGSSNYCGFTWNGNSWFSGPYSTNEAWKNFLAVAISSSSASTIIKAKLDTSDNGCKNNGSYNFKIQRFTTGGSSSFDTQSEQSLTVDIPTPTPTLTPVPTSVPTSSPTNTGVPAVTPTSKPLPTPTIYNAPTTKKVSPTINLIISPTDYPTTVETSGTVLGENIEASGAGKGNGKELPIFFLLFGSGVMFLAAAVVLGVKSKRDR